MQLGQGKRSVRALPARVESKDNVFLRYACFEKPQRQPLRCTITLDPDLAFAQTKMAKHGEDTAITDPAYVEHLILIMPLIADRDNLNLSCSGPALCFFIY
jgi:hypothetical protein